MRCAYRRNNIVYDRCRKRQPCFIGPQATQVQTRSRWTLLHRRKLERQHVSFSRLLNVLRLSRSVARLVESERRADAGELRS